MTSPSVVEEELVSSLAPGMRAAAAPSALFSGGHVFPAPDDYGAARNRRETLRSSRLTTSPASDSNSAGESWASARSTRFVSRMTSSRALANHRDTVEWLTP